MNMAEAAAFRELKARVESTEKQIADLTRRFDAYSAADRARQEPKPARQQHG